MATSPRLEVMPGSVVDPTFEELCLLDWTLHAMNTSLIKLGALRKRGIASFVARRDDFSLEEMTERAEEIEQSISHSMTISRWAGMCLARRNDLLRMMCP